MMMIFAALIVLCVAAGVRPAEQVPCHHPILCPCGNTREYVKVCTEEENPCIRWSRCKTCQDGLDGCLECPEGYGGLWCSKSLAELPRKKRQTFGYPVQNFGGQVFFGNRDGPCPEINSPKLGSIRCAYSANQKTCVGKCLPGYTFDRHESESEITLTCTGSYFTPLREFPPCKSGGHCDLIVQGAGSFNCTTGMSGTRCDVICAGRYMERYFCYPGRPWEPQLPYCVHPKVVARRNICPDPGFIDNGWRETEDGIDTAPRQSFEEGESVVYSCIDKSFIWQGSPRLTCRSDGKWSSPLPKCTRKTQSPDTRDLQCRDPGVDPNGRRDPPTAPNDRGFPPGSVLEYFCNDGYNLDGEKSIFCYRTGKWSSERPTCKAQSRQAGPDFLVLQCRDPGVDPNGRRNSTYPPNDRGFPPGSLLEFSCNNGYDLDGPKTIFCLTTGKWSTERPTCKLRQIDTKSITCRKPPSFSNGRIVYYPPIVSGQRRRPQTVSPNMKYPFGSLLLYSCNSGHILQGSDSLTCEENAEWSSDPPVCVREVPSLCSDLGVDPNGYRNPRLPPNRQGFPHGAEVEYFCNQGYVLEGEKILVCLSSGDWLSARPRCVPQTPTPADVYCPNPRSIANGRVVYYPTLDSRRGSDADMDVDEFPEGGRLKYSCNTGYFLDGEEFITCQSNGRWSPKPPVCISVSGRTIRYCDETGLIANGQVEYILPISERASATVNRGGFPQYPEGTRLEYSCDNGYVLHGAAELTCQDTGDWSDEPPTCITKNVKNIMYCRNLGPLLNGRIRDFSHMAGPRTGSTSLVSEDTPEFPEGTTLKYECDDGYITDGVDTIKCESSGIWSGAPPKCISQCGYSFSGATNRVLHGNKTTPGEWPWVVAVAVPKGNSSRIICGGAVLNTRTVITAAHCVTGAPSFILYFGKHYRRNELDDQHVQVARSDRVIIHPNYDRVTMDSDIALIKFKPKIKYTLRVQPICTPTGTSTTLNLETGMKGFVTGWGENEKQVNSGELMMAHLPYQSNKDCIDSLRENVDNYNPVLTQNMFCAGYPEANQSTCRGDSGSPFVFFDPVTERYTIEGLVSYTVEGQCGLSGIYSIYTKVYQFIPWIYKTLLEHR